MQALSASNSLRQKYINKKYIKNKYIKYIIKIYKMRIHYMLPLFYKINVERKKNKKPQTSNGSFIYKYSQTI